VASKTPRKAALEKRSGSRLSDIAYTKVLELLFDRRLPAGSFVSQGELMEMTGVAIAPLRDALRILETEGIVTIHPRTGIEFVKPGLELTRSTFQFRGVIESAAVAVFAETASDAEIAALETRHEAVIAEVERSGLLPETLIHIEELETVLHSSIVGSLNNALIDSSYRRVRNYLQLIRLNRRLTPPLALRSLKEHMAIIEACRKRDAAEAVAALQKHFASAMQRSLGLY